MAEMAEGSSSTAHNDLGDIPTAPCGAAVKRHVLLIGTTGKGKTTISNMLQNNGSDKAACEGPGEVGHGSSAGTKTPRLAVMPERQMMVCDTMGLGDSEMSNEEVLQTLRTIFNSAKIGLSCVIVVSSMGRWSREERMNIELLNTVFEAAWTKQSILVLTHYEDRLEDKKEVLDAWSGKDPEVKDILSKFAHIIVTNNSIKPLTEESTRPLRANCLKELNKIIGEWDATFTIRAESLLDVVKRILDKYFNFYGHIKQRALTTFNHMMALSGEGAIGGLLYSGTCPLCLDDIDLSRLAMTECNHSFHSQCIGAYVQSQLQGGSELPCPCCRRHIKKIYCDRTPCDANCHDPKS